MQRFQERLKLRRNRMGWGQKTLAQKSGVAERVISSIESGEAALRDKSINLSTVEALAAALGVNPLWLLGSDRVDGNELMLKDEPDHTLEALQKLEQAESNIDMAKRLLAPSRGSFSYREKTPPNSELPADAKVLAARAEEKHGREHRK
jgi:transcriptional regulator with XRE-family HTH domain